MDVIDHGGGHWTINGDDIAGFLNDFTGASGGGSAGGNGGGNSWQNAYISACVPQTGEKVGVSSLRSRVAYRPQCI